MHKIKLAIEGCCHGNLDIIYKSILQNDKITGVKTNVLLICGDFQAIRNYSDYNTLAVPQKYRQLGDFHHYYSGKKAAPILTICIGGNHEASSYLWELYHGGWLAPNIYYLGRAGSVLINGIRISGASCIYKPKDYVKGYFEKIPYNNYTLRSTYHIRQFDVERLSHLPKPDIFLSHDWPLSIEKHGDINDLIRRKPWFKDEIAKNELGSPPLLTLLEKLRPRRWYSAHLHVHFKAKWLPFLTKNKRSASIEDDKSNKRAKASSNESEQSTSKDNPEEIKIEDEDEEQQLQNTNPEEIKIGDEESLKDEQIESAQNKQNVQRDEEDATLFTALDKSLPKRQYLDFIELDAPIEIKDDNVDFMFDPHWLAITRAFHPLMSLEETPNEIPTQEEIAVELNKQLEWCYEHLSNVSIESIQNFTKTAPSDGQKGFTYKGQPLTYNNPQTEAFCSFLSIPNYINQNLSDNTDFQNETQNKTQSIVN